MFNKRSYCYFKIPGTDFQVGDSFVTSEAFSGKRFKVRIIRVYYAGSYSAIEWPLEGLSLVWYKITNFAGELAYRVRRRWYKILDRWSL
jgi:hypothetical protein